MIRRLAILAVVTICCYFAASTSAKAVVYDEADILKGQKAMFDLMFYRFETGKIDPELYRKGRDYDFEAKISDFDPEYQMIVRNFLTHYNSGMLPRGRIFSVYCPHAKQETQALFRLFYYAPDIWNFVYMSIWASINVNEYQFHYALRISLYNRLDTKFINLPPYFETYPEFFFNTDAMKQVYDFKMSLAKNGDQVKDGYNHIVLANYTNWYITDTVDDEYKLNYFTEDIGLNEFYQNYNMRYVHWISDAEHSNLGIGNRGELWAYGHRMMYNRYCLERLSNGLDDVEDLEWDKRILTGYSPRMIYPNGMHFPGRKEMSEAPVWYKKYVRDIMEIESRIQQVIDSGYMITRDGKLKEIQGKDGANIIANLVQGNNGSLNIDYYGSFDTLGIFILGFSPKPYDHHNLVPSALEHYATSFRDPGFFRLSKMINGLLWSFQEKLDPYTPEQLAFNGVKIESVDIVEKNLYTHFERVDTLIDRYWYSNNKKVAKITARQYRLNHKPFTFDIKLNSEKDVKASIRIFLAPKSDVRGHKISDNYKNFFEIDYFVEELKKGENIIKRRSDRAPWFAPDFSTADVFEERPVTIEEQFSFGQRRFGLPYRLLLPKGRVGGMTFQLFVYVSEFVVEENRKMEPLLGARDDKPLGFPVDRPMFNFKMPNMKLFDVKIIHNEEVQINLTTA